MKSYLFGFVSIFLCSCNDNCNTSEGNIDCHNNEINKPIFSLNTNEIFIEEPLRTLARAVEEENLVSLVNYVKEGGNINLRGRHGLTLLYWSLKNKKKKSFQKLLELGADPNLILGMDNSVIYWSAGLNDPFYLDMVLKYRGDPNLIDPRQLETPLFRAATPDGKGNINSLISSGAKLNFRNKFGETALLTAASLNQYDVVYTLITAGADYAIHDRWNNGLDYFLKTSESMDKSSELYKWRNKVIKLIESKRQKKQDLFHEKNQQIDSK
ncbi:MAG TPA: ankyrin repeat domain-containing protein [Aeromonadales bacterium]|nr:ankyrin repeat domain-containing protein [Aeromonadales bacterium]